MKSRACAAALFILLAETRALAQPPLPPEELPRAVGTVKAVQGTESITLVGGGPTAVSENLRLSGVAALTELAAGDLVEVVYDEEGLIIELQLLPRLAQTRPVAEVAAAAGTARRTTWRYDGEVYPNSILAAGATLTLNVAAVALEGKAAYQPGRKDALAATFRIVGSDEAMLWRQELQPGEVIPLRCSLPGGPLRLHCAATDGSTPPAEACIWASLQAVLADSDSVPLHPAASTALIAALAEVPGAARAGRMAVAVPRIVGLSGEMASDLQNDLLVAAARRFPIAGKVAVGSSAQLSAQDQQAAAALGAETILAAELRYAPEGSELRAWIVGVEGNVTLAEATTKLPEAGPEQHGL